MVTTMGGVTPGLQWVEARDDAKHPSVPRAVPLPQTRNDQTHMSVLRVRNAGIRALQAKVSGPRAASHCRFCKESFPAIQHVWPSG